MREREDLNPALVFIICGLALDGFELEVCVECHNVGVGGLVWFGLV